MEGKASGPDEKGPLTEKQTGRVKALSQMIQFTLAEDVRTKITLANMKSVCPFNLKVNIIIIKVPGTT